MDLDVRARSVHFHPVSEGQVSAASFLDNRLAIDWQAAQRVPLLHIDGLPPPAHPPVWLWHTSFCGSTLLARALGVDPHSVALREPLVLRRMGDAKERGIPLADYPVAITALLSRPWAPGGRVVIKPTHAAWNVAIELLDATPCSRAIVLTSSLEDFLVSNLKKSRETLAKIPQLVERAARAGSFVERLPREAFAPPSVLCTAALQWAVQREVVADVLEHVSPARMRIMDWRLMLSDVPEFTAGAARWAGLDVPDQSLRQHAGHVAARHAKALSTPYSASEQAAESAVVQAAHGEEILDALRWSERWLLPAMRATARATHGGWT